MPAGRPTKYKPEYCEQMIEFFDREPTEKRFKSRVEDDEKGTKTTYEERGINLPTFTSFARKIGVCDDTVNEWAKVHPAFSEAVGICKKLQEDIWKINALNGNYNSTFAVFLGKNVFGYKDKSEVDTTHTINQMPPVQLNGEEIGFDIGEDVKQIEVKDE